MEDASAMLSGSQIRVEIDHESVVIDMEDMQIDLASIQHVSGSTYSILYRGKSLTATLESSTTGYLQFNVDGMSFRCNLMNRRMQLVDNLLDSQGTRTHEGELMSPMPGLVVKVLAETGTQVKKDTPLIVLEAMKMENEIRSPINAIVTKIHVRPGESVSKNVLLISLNALPTG